MAVKRLPRLVFDLACGFTIGLLVQMLGIGLPETVAGTLAALLYLVLLRHLRRSKSLKLNLVTSTAAVGLLAVTVYLAVAFHSPLHHTRAFTPTVWLPNPHARSADPLYQLGSVRTSWDIMYGRGLQIRPAIDYGFEQTMVYETRATAGLTPGLCPNVGHIGSISSGGCRKIGTVRGSPVYAINRSLPLGDYEVYVRFGDTLIYMNGLVINKEEALPYLKTFRKVPAADVAAELAANTKAAKAKDAYLTKQQATVRQRLPFTPVLPAATALPPGWLSLDDTRIGGSLSRPDLVETSYGDGKGNIVVVMAVPADSFHLQRGSCYPVPHEAKPLGCMPYGTQGYYYANGIKMQYLFRQVGNAMTITQILLADDVFTTPGKETAILQVGQSVADSLHPVDPSALRHVDFVEGYGDY
jgi:hypothetical protein